MTIKCSSLAAGLAWAGLSLLNPAHAEGHGPHWTYSGTHGAGHWAELDEQFKTCKLGRAQSPINIKTAQVQTDREARAIGFAYTGSAAEVVNNGHTIQVNLQQGGSIQLDGKDYQLLQFHFHTPSEERVNGNAYPLVAHLVHKDAEGHLAVVAVLFKLGAENATLKAVFDAMPREEGGKRVLDGTLNLSALLPAETRYYAFTGSLTTPPCSEEVRWQVLRQPVTLSAAQLKAFRQLYPMNARSVQPLNGRVVKLAG